MALDYLLVSLITIIGFGPILIEYFSKRFDLFNIKNAFIVYYVIQLGFSGILSLSSKYPSEIGLSPIYFHSYYTKALFAALIGLLCFQLGYYISFGKTIQIPKNLVFKWKITNSKFILITYYFIGILSFLIFLKVNGGITEFLYNRESFRAGGVSGQGFLIFPATHVFNLGSITYMIGSSQEKTTKHFIYSFFFLLISIVPAFLMGFRGLIVLPILEFLVIYNYRYKAISLTKILPISLILVLAFVAYGIIREIPPEIKVSPEMALEIVENKPELAYAFLSRSKGTEVVASVIKKLEQTGDYDYGYKSLIETLTIFIPGALWPDKPITSSVRFTTYFFADDLAFSRGFKQDTWGGTSPTILGEAFWNFGWAGVIFGLALFGWIVGKIYQTFTRNKENLFVLLLYAEVYPLFVMMAEAVQGYLNSISLHIIILSFTYFLLKLKISIKNI